VFILCFPPPKSPELYCAGTVVALSGDQSRNFMLTNVIKTATVFLCNYFAVRDRSFRKFFSKIGPMYFLVHFRLLFVFTQTLIFFICSDCNRFLQESDSEIYKHLAASGIADWNYLPTDLRQPDLSYSCFRQSL